MKLKVLRKYLSKEISDQRAPVADFEFRTPVDVHSPTLSSPSSLSPPAGTPSPTTPSSHAGDPDIFRFDKLTCNSPQTSPVKSSTTAPRAGQPIWPKVATVINPPHQQQQHHHQQQQQQRRQQQQISRSISLVSSSSSPSSSSAAAATSSHIHQSGVHNTLPASAPPVFCPLYHASQSTHPFHYHNNQTVDTQYTGVAFTSNDNSSVQQQQQQRHCFNNNNSRISNNNSLDCNNGSCSSTINLNTNNRFSHSHNQNCDELDDLEGIQPFEPFDLNNNISNTNTCPMSTSCNRRSSNGNTDSNNLIINNSQTQSSHLPPVSTFFCDQAPKEGLGDAQSIFLSGPILDEEPDIKPEYGDSRSSSCSSMEDTEEMEYTNLRNVTDSFTEDLCYTMSDGYWPTISDQVCLSELVKSEPCDSLYVNPFDSSYSNTEQMFAESPSHDSEGYESSSPEYGGVPQTHYYQYLQRNASIPEAAPQLHHRPIVELQYDHPHPSPMSDEGFVDGTNITEENLPDFAKIQHLPAEPDRQPVRRRSSASSPKEKKKVARDLQPVAEKERRKPGRKPGQVSNVLHLWEFMRDLLQSPDNPGIIEWISKSEGVFRVVNSTEVARLWGEKKKNKKKMTYEKLSRSLRYSRLEGYFSDLPKDKNYPKKLCFKFGPKSKDWH